MSSSIDIEFSQFFTQKWVITISSQPSLKLFRFTPEHHSAWLLPIVTNPENNEFQDSKNKVWDAAAKEEWRKRTESDYAEANTKHHHLTTLIELDGKIVGYGDIYTIREGVASIGIVLEKEARGRGIAKLAVKGLIQLCFDHDIKPVLGTMKANKPMRALMANLGVPEVEQITDLPGRGVVAELHYDIERTSWKDVDMRIVFEKV